MITDFIVDRLANKVRLTVQQFEPLLTTELFEDTKDPCPVFDGKKWHIFGSGGTVKTETWKVLHATAPYIDGPWKEESPVTLKGVSGDHFAAPGVVYDLKEQRFHMFIQSEFLATGGNIEHFVSQDAKTFTHVDTALTSLPDSPEAGIYDPHPAIVNGQKYIVYSAMGKFGKLTDTATHNMANPEIYLAKSSKNSWYGPWKRLGRILGHEDVPHHNQMDHPDYEWGLEGPQLVQLPSGKVLLNAVCFLPEGMRGKRQRVFFAFADHVQGPYTTLGTVLQPTKEGWQSGENGHAAALVIEDTLTLFYQARPLNGLWRYGMATCSLSHLEQLIERRKHKGPLEILKALPFHLSPQRLFTLRDRLLLGKKT